MPRDEVHQERYVLHAIPRDASAEIRVSLIEHDGVGFAELRLFRRNRAGVPVPTPKGFTIPLARLDELELAVAKLREADDHIRFTPHLGRVATSRPVGPRPRTSGRTVSPPLELGDHRSSPDRTSGAGRPAGRPATSRT